ncbi:elongator complex protein 2 isoform X1 [Parasteatoda tepidariorum]|uniref:elongator complex protein 2 isoform X1 n=1 Tax=Parasteatoda tepidariorum TaxID=114398 RepID=UPI001C71B1C1|nr:elongator complex protein 2 isoform X1 [Parasteatoda tepidariorum]
MTVETKCIYCSCSCNKSPNSMDWGTNGFICYAACNSIHIYEYEDNKFPHHYKTLNWHKKLVTSVHWIKRSNNSENELIATSADFTASVWTYNGSEFKFSYSLVGHTGVVRSASGIYLQDKGCEKLMIVTMSIDCSVKLWICEKDSEALCIQTISFGSGFGLDAKFAVLNNPDELILLVGADDSRIHLYTQAKDMTFIPTVQLKGHQDWIQSIDVIRESQSALLIASASQDCHIRIWKISPVQEKHMEADLNELQVDAVTFSTVAGNAYSISLESVISAHENWVYSAHWRQSRDESGNTILQILSASMDKTLIVWELDSNSNIWLEKVRLGEVGGNTLGFYGASFSPKGDIIIGHGYQGAVHVWKLNYEEDSWLPGLSFGGHYASVQDIGWDPDGEYLMSCSTDQTSRLHAPYVAHGKKNSWYEIARPQVHGYDMVCLSILNRFKCVSAGDEKVLRVFEAPRNFADTLKNIVKLDIDSYVKDKMAEGASVPSLGLSNKAVFEEDIIKVKDSLDDQNSKKTFKDQYPDFYYTPVEVTEPPTEENLLQNTLWPETQKLYGHPYEVFSVTSNHAKTLVASVCKASKIEYAGIILWCTSTWKQIGYLSFHTLTITQIEFSPDDSYLLSVSRDRMWAIYKHFPSESPPYRKIANLDRKLGIHSRIIWGCSWTFDSLYFATASRDKKVAIWGKDISKDAENFSLQSEPLEVEDAATAVSFAPGLFQNKYIIAIGLENGSIMLSSWSLNMSWCTLQILDQNTAHHLNVNKLRFSPVHGEAGSKQKNEKILQLASCGNDHHVKVYNIYFDSLT